MGYRSDVFIKVHLEDEDRLVEILKENEFIAIKNYSDKDYVVYIIDDVKWHDGFKDVKAVNDFIEEESEYPKGLIAIGEDNAIAEYGEPSEVGLWVITQVGWN